jgi:hypothetical protein
LTGIKRFSVQESDIQSTLDVHGKGERQRLVHADT